MIRTEISGAEIAEEMEKERRFFQLQMCEVRAPASGRGFGPNADALLDALVQSWLLREP